MEKGKKGKKQKVQAEGKAKAIKEPKEKRTFIGSLINADLWQKMKMLSVKEGKPAGKLLDMAMKEYLEKAGNR